MASVGAAKKILIAALATEGETERLSYLRPILAEIRSRNTAVIVEEFTRQPPIKADSRWHVVRKALRQVHLTRAWRKYLLWKSENGPGVLGVVSALRLRSKLVLATFRGAFAPKATRISSFKERCAANKHLLAWRHCVDGDFDVMLVLESDVIFPTGSSEGLVAMIREVSVDAPFYVDLAGGFLFSDLGMSELVTAPRTIAGINFATFSKPVTNTTCAYMIDKSLAKMLIEKVEEHPDMELSPVDWMLNAAFIRLVANGVTIRCLHSDPPYLVHGSFAGNYSSAIR